MTMYATCFQFPPPNLNFMMRTELAPDALADTVRRLVAARDRDIPVENLVSMDRLIGDSLASQRVTAITLTLLSAVAMLLACIGLYGVLAYSVSQRTHEIGIRIALGAAQSNVLRMVVRQGLVLALTGVGIGLAGALSLTRFIGSLLFAVRAADPWTFAIAALGLLGVTLVASYIPARRAAKVDPMVALRYQ
jgi:putative ABC transport system permease protein